MSLQRWNKEVQSSPPSFFAAAQTYGYVYVFPTMGQGQVALVSVSVPNSPPGTQWDVFVGGQLIGSVYGASPLGPIWLAGGDVVTMTSAANNFFLQSPGGAVEVGVVGNQGELSPPGAINGGGLPVGVNVIGVSAIPSTSSTTTTLQLSQNARGVIIVSDQPPAYPPPLSGPYFVPLNLAAMQLQAGQTTDFVPGAWWYQIEAGSTFTVSFKGVPIAWVAYEVDYDFDFDAAYDALIQNGCYIGLSITGSSGGFLVDSSGNGSTLTKTGTVTQVASPAGAAFGDAAQTAGAGSYLSGPAGVTNADGAVTGTGWTCEFIYDASSFAAVPYIIGRLNEWIVVINPTGTVQVIWYDSTGTANYLNSGTHALTAGVANNVAVSWDSSNVRVFVGGTLDATYPMTTHVAPVITTTLVVFYADTVANSTIDEVRISSVCRYTATYVPAVAEFATDANTGMLYHFDVPSSTIGAVITLSGWETTIMIEAPGSTTPTVTDSKGVAYPVTVVAAGGLWWASLPSANGSPITVSASAVGVATLRSVNPYLG